MSTPSPSNLPNEQATPKPFCRNQWLDSPECLKCCVSMSLNEGCEWPDDERLLLCSDCMTELAGNLLNELTAAQAQIAKLEHERDNAILSCPVNRGEIGIVHAHVADLKKRKEPELLAQIAKLTEERDAALRAQDATYTSCNVALNQHEAAIRALRAQVADLTRSLEAKQQVLDAATRQVSTIEDFLWGRQYCTELYISPLGFNGNEAWQVELNWGDGTQAFQGASVAKALASAMVEAMERKAKRATPPAQSTAQGTEEKS